MNKQTNACKKECLHHLHRINGQLAVLEKYLVEDKDCMQVALLTTSIVKSFDTLRIKTLEGILLAELNQPQKIQDHQKFLHQLLKLYKK